MSQQYKYGAVQREIVEKAQEVQAQAVAVVESSDAPQKVLEKYTPKGLVCYYASVSGQGKQNKPCEPPKVYCVVCEWHPLCTSCWKRADRKHVAHCWGKLLWCCMCKKMCHKKCGHMPEGDDDHAWKLRNFLCPHCHAEGVARSTGDWTMGTTRNPMSKYAQEAMAVGGKPMHFGDDDSGQKDTGAASSLDKRDESPEVVIVPDDDKPEVADNLSDTGPPIGIKARLALKKEREERAKEVEDLRILEDKDVQKSADSKETAPWRVKKEENPSC